MFNEQDLIVKTQVHFDLIDRIKILFGAIPEIEVKIIVPTKIERYNSVSKTKLISRTKSKFSQDKPNYGYTAPDEYAQHSS